MKTICLILTWWLSLTAGHAEERIWVQAKVNGTPVKLGFDTAADYSVLFRPTAERLGLNTIDPPPGTPARVPGKVAMGFTEECDFSFWGETLRTRLRVVDMPAKVAASTKTEGVLAWWLVKDNVMLFRWAERKMILQDAVPEEAKTWLRYRLVAGQNKVLFEVPLAEGESCTVLVDTGSEDGVALAPAGWTRWSAAHPDQPTTLEGLFTPVDGIVVTPKSWANEWTLGSLALKHLPIAQASPGETTLPRYAATLGLAALRRLEMVVDGEHGFVYLRPLDTPPAGAYEHNRLGAVFVPRDLQSDDMFAHVAKGSPAEKAGIRDGDLLVKIDGLDKTQWRADPNQKPFGWYWSRPAGTKYTLTLKRGEAEYQAVVELQDILGLKPEPQVEERKAN